MHCSPEAQSVTEIGPPSTLLPPLVTPLSRTTSLPLRNLSITAPGFQFSVLLHWLLVKCAPAIIPSLLCRDARFQPCCQRCNHHATSISRPRPSHPNTKGSTFFADAPNPTCPRPMSLCRFFSDEPTLRTMICGPSCSQLRLFGAQYKCIKPHPSLELRLGLKRHRSGCFSGGAAGRN